MSALAIENDDIIAAAGVELAQRVQRQGSIHARKDAQLLPVDIF
jgi:hypothetical protein